MGGGGSSVSRGGSLSLRRTDGRLNAVYTSFNVGAPKRVTDGVEN